MGTYPSLKKTCWLTCLILSISICGAVIAQPVCIGAKTAKSYWVYFHGIDDLSVGVDERKSRKILEALSKNLPVAFGVARSPNKCPHDSDKLCWDHSSKESIAAHVESSVKHLKDCQNSRPIAGYIGFSNGAYLISKYAQMCLKKTERFIAVGGGGQLVFDKKSPPKKLECGRLSLMIGRRDLSFKKVRSLFQLLNSRYPAVFIPFEGGHMLPFKPLKNLLKGD